MKKREKYSVIGLVLNTCLFVAKIVIGLIANSMALISDALNSFIDIISSIAIHVSVKVSGKKPDDTHPFGHHRAEPIAGIVVAILTGILGFEVAKTSIVRLFSTQQEIIGYGAVIVLVITIITKLFMAKFFISIGKSMKSPALKATGIDSRNDVIISSIALFGVVGAISGYHKLDDIAALVISGFIFYFGYMIAIENIDYLMGKAPSKKLVDKIIKLAKKVNGVKGINEVRAHYIGSKINIEIHVEVDEKATTRTSHDIGKAVQRRIEELDEIEKAFIHVDPV